ncbi:YafY family protein [Paenibacillus campi]|uniref:helix-turn-helix transcriptional regulator n=1 Tax=Paenibacillus campi TaxID=3106031 RepID=UPI002AFE42A6|nr:YafY family protein [Paenibacillus sp. SGZ-1009]
MNKTDRMLAIVIELQRYGMRRAEDLAMQFETSVRTIYRDVQALSEAGIPVIGAPGIGYSLLDGYFLPPVSFTAEEAVTLLVGADFVHMLLDAEYGTKARHAQKKIEAILTKPVQDEATRVRSAIRLLHERMAGTTALDKERMEPLRRAILHKQSVHFHYFKSLSEPEQSRHSVRTVDPYGLVFTQVAWMLVAFCHERQAIRHFRLSRMRELTVLEQTFEVQPGFDLHARKSLDDRHVLVQMRFEASVGAQVQETGNFYMESLEPDDDGWLVTFRVRRIEELVQWTLSWGAAVEVLEPESLRQRLRAEVEKMHKRY